MLSTADVMVKRLALLLLVVASISIVAAYGSAFLPGGAGTGSALLMAFGIAAMAVSLMTLGAVREGERLGILGFAFAFVFIVLMAGFTAALFLPDTDTALMRLWLGLPPRAAILIYGIGFLPVLVLPFVYARTFESMTLRPGDLEAIRRIVAETAETEENALTAENAGKEENAGKAQKAGNRVEGLK